MDLGKLFVSASISLWLKLLGLMVGLLIARGAAQGRFAWLIGPNGVLARHGIGPFGQIVLMTVAAAVLIFSFRAWSRAVMRAKLSLESDESAIEPPAPNPEPPSYRPP